METDLGYFPHEKLSRLYYFVWSVGKHSKARTNRRIYIHMKTDLGSFPHKKSGEDAWDDLSCRPLSCRPLSGKKAAISRALLCLMCLMCLMRLMCLMLQAFFRKKSRYF